MEKVLDLALSLVVFAGALMAGWVCDRVAADPTPRPYAPMARRRGRSPREQWAQLRRWWVGDSPDVGSLYDLKTAGSPLARLPTPPRQRAVERAQYGV